MFKCSVILFLPSLLVLVLVLFLVLFLFLPSLLLHDHLGSCAIWVNPTWPR